MRPRKGCYSGVASGFVRTIFFAVVVALFVCSVMILTGQRGALNRGGFRPSKPTSSRTFPAGTPQAHRVDKSPLTPPADNGAPVGQDTPRSDKGGESVSPSNPDQTKPDDLPKADLGTEVSHGDRHSSKIALTFDAGADARPAQSILETLSRYNIHCTFFLTGEWIERNPKLTQQIALAGHEIGNHTYSHRRLTGLTDREIAYEAEKTEQLVLQLTGHSTKPLLRVPYGARDKRVLASLGQNGYQSIYWDVDSWDSVKTDITSDEIKQRVLSKIQNGSIVLMHCGSKATADALDSMLRELLNLGYQPVTVSELLNS